MGKFIAQSIDSAELRILFREALLKMGARPGGQFESYSVTRLSQLHEFCIQSDIDKLVHRGMHVQAIAVAAILINVAPRFDQLFESFGDKRTKEKKVQSLLESVHVLRELDQIVGPALPPDTKVLGGWIAPKAIIESLERYAQLITTRDSILAIVGINSFEEVVKFGFADAVHRITGKYLDREVSAITGAALQKKDYDETAHRIWRKRAGTRSIEPGVWLAEILVVLNELVSPNSGSN